MITKDNVREKIETFLKTLNVRYVVIDSDEIGCLYEVFVSSLLSYIQIEYNMKDENDSSIVIQFYIKLDDYGNNLYNQIWENNDGESSIEGEIDELLAAATNINRSISKIASHIESINSICDAAGLDPETFITVNHDF